MFSSLRELKSILWVRLLWFLALQLLCMHAHACAIIVIFLGKYQVKIDLLSSIITKPSHIIYALCIMILFEHDTLNKKLIIITIKHISQYLLHNYNYSHTAHLQGLSKIASFSSLVPKDLRIRMLWVKADVNDPVQAVTAAATKLWVAAVYGCHTIRSAVLLVLVGFLEGTNDIAGVVAALAISPVNKPSAESKNSIQLKYMTVATRYNYKLQKKHITKKCQKPFI